MRFYFELLMKNFKDFYLIKPISHTSQKSQHITRGSQFETKRINTDKYRNSCLQAALRMKRDAYKNKNTNPRRAEVTTDKYQVKIQTIKLTKNINPKRLQVS